jgi:hypothetical protein
MRTRSALSSQAKAAGANAAAIKSSAEKLSTTAFDKFRSNRKANSAVRDSRFSSGDMGGKPYSNASSKRPGELDTQPASLRAQNPKHSPREREYLKADTNHALILQTRGRCAFVNERGERCTEDRYLHPHHIVLARITPGLRVHLCGSRCFGQSSGRQGSVQQVSGTAAQFRHRERQRAALRMREESFNRGFRESELKLPSLFKVKQRLRFYSARKMACRFVLRPLLWNGSWTRAMRFDSIGGIAIAKD